MQLLVRTLQKISNSVLPINTKKNPSTLEIIGLSSFQHALPISPKAAKQILFHENV